MTWGGFFRRQKRVSECTEEMQVHIEAETADNIARGMSPEDAYVAARRKFGNTTQICEDIYRMNSIGFLNGIWQDVRYALRTMRKSPVFTATAILTLALGIGGNTAMFTVIRSVLLKPLPYREPDRLVYLSLNNPRRNRVGMPFSIDRLEQMRTRSRTFAALGAFLQQPEDSTISGGGAPEPLKSARVSGNFLEILGINPVLGRSFNPQEDTPGGADVAMISTELWRRRFQSDPHIAGKSMTLNATTYTIIGVLPAGFEFPFSGVDVWVTKPSHSSVLAPRYWDLSLLHGFGRLKPGVTMEQAQAEMAVLSDEYKRAEPGPDPGSIAVVSLKDQLVRNVHALFWILLGAVVFVLLIACANVAGLLLARSASRKREFAVRTAVGARRGRLARQIFTESVALSLAGGSLGLLLARWLLGAIVKLGAFHFTGPANVLYLPNANNLEIDIPILMLTASVSAVAGLLFALFPALQFSKPNLVDDLRESGASSGSANRKRILGINTRALLVVGQIGLSVVLLIGATLLMKSFIRLRNVNPGFQPDGVLTAKIALPPLRYDTPQKRAAFFNGVIRNVEALPGVESAAVAMSLPTTSWTRTNIMRVEGEPPLNENEPLLAIEQSVTPAYFRTLGIPMKAGREFAARDNAEGAPPTIIINERLARLLWPNYPRGVNPVGHRIMEGYDKAIGWFEIVGVSADAHEGGLAMQAPPEFYVPCTIHPPQRAYMAVRAKAAPLSFVGAVREAVRKIDPDQAITDVKTMDSVIAATLGQRRGVLWLLGSFAGIALLLAVIGIYGVVAYSVAQRTQEMGIRRALGAQQQDILRLVLRQALVLALSGVIAGTAAAFALTRVLKKLLYGVTATDPSTFVLVAVLFIVITLIAGYIPARRAARIDPMAALRVG